MIETVDVQEAERRIDSYLKNDVAFPFFVTVNGPEYVELRDKLQRSLQTVYVSSFCQKDSFPDYDRLLDYLKACDCPSLLLGLGEAIKYSGYNRIARQLKDKQAGAKVVIFCRGSYKLFHDIADTDRKFSLLQYIHVGSVSELHVVQLMVDVARLEAIDGFKAMLSEFEKGDKEKLIVKSGCQLNSCQVIRNDYDALKLKNPSFNISEDCLSPEQWKDYALDQNCSEYPVVHWRTYLSCLIKPSDNDYQNYVVNYSANASEYSKNILYALYKLNPDDNRFHNYYESRKRLLRNDESMNNDESMYDYVLYTAKKGANRIYYLTDNTLVERHAILQAIGKAGIVPNAISWIYPDLWDYLMEDYNFACDNGQEITSYFSEYKHLKVRNQLNEGFISRVQRLAEPDKRIYNSLVTRGRLLESFDQHQDFLYWLDALGVEYLGYIQKHAQKLGISVNIKIGRAELPTLTCLNREFYDSWSGGKESSKELDNLKHKGTGDAATAEYPAHLADELSVIDKVLNQIAKILKGGQFSRVILTSDHGASRLVVVNGQENKWRMSSKGEHSGRCCPCSEIDSKPDCATEENGYWVLANYDRFQGGRRAEVEVHGGALLEEVLVPVISVTLQGQVIEVKNLSPVILADKFKQKAELKLDCSAHVDKLQIQFNGKSYDGVQDSSSDNLYTVSLKDFTKPGQYNADVYANDSYVCTIKFEIQHRGMQTKKSQDDFFSF